MKTDMTLNSNEPLLERCYCNNTEKCFCQFLFNMSFTTYTKIFHPHLWAGVKAGLLCSFVPVVPWPQFIGEPQITSWYPTFSDSFTQFLLTAIALCCVNVAYATFSECIHNGIMRVSATMWCAWYRDIRQNIESQKQCQFSSNSKVLLFLCYCFFSHQKGFSTLLPQQILLLKKKHQENKQSRKKETYFTFCVNVYELPMDNIA